MTVNDKEWKFLAEQTGMSAPFNDMYFHYLQSLGYVGTLQDMIAASGLGLTPSKGVGVLPLQVVNTRGEVDVATGSLTTSGNRKHLFRSRHYIGDKDVTADLILSYGSFSVSGSGETAGPAYDVKADIEIDGTCVAVTFGGSATGAVSSGAVDYQSDPLQPSDFGLEAFAAGSEFWVKTERLYAEGVTPTYYSTTVLNPSITGENAMRGASTATSQIGTPGVIVTTGGWSQLGSISGGPMAVLGRPTQRMFAMGIIGASIEMGLNDNKGDGVNGAGGYARRGLADVDGAKVARLNLAASGESVETFLTSNTRRLAMLQYVNHTLNGYGGNDFSNGTATGSETADRMAQVDTAAKAEGVKKVGRVRMTPKSNSTDSFATTENQTVRTGFLAFRTTMDDAATAALGDGSLDFVVDIATPLEPLGEPGKWVANSTTDGTHPQPAPHGTIADTLSSAVRALLAAY